MRSMYFSFENERLLQLVTMRIRFVRCAISTFGNEQLIRLSIFSLWRKCHVNGVFRIIEELIRTEQQTEKAHC